MNKRTRGTAANEQLEALLRENEARARQIALRLTRNESAADELLQEAAYQVLRSWKQYDPLKSFAGWYLTIVHNLFLSARRASKNKVSLYAPAQDGDEQRLIDVLVDAQSSVLAELERGEVGAALSKALGALSKKHRAVIQVCDLEGASYEEAALKLGIPVGTVRSRLSRARAALGRDPAVRRLA